MGIAQYMAKEMMKEIGNRSREFYEFVLPAIDIFEDGNELVVLIDLPGFSKNDIKLRIVNNVLSINAKREVEDPMGTVYFKHRPTQISKKVALPLSLEDGEEATGMAKYVDGVVSLRIPMPKSSIIPVS
ncbi:MAG: archaeal heat shock protein Hsp14 [Nitrososphaeraceae archaeon]|jgi:HSP20 family molecular chaperone IbpA